MKTASLARCQAQQHGSSEGTAGRPAMGAGASAKEFLEDGGSPGWNLFVGKELPADLQSGFRGVDADDAGEQAEVVDVPGPGGEGLHREDMAW